MAKRVSKTGGKPANPTEERAAAEKKQTAQAKKKNKLVKGGKLGRPRKLTPDQLRRGVEDYFASISFQETVTREEDIILSVDPETGGVTFALDDMGHRVKRIVPVLNAAGKPMTRTVYTEAPGDFGLCNFLKISRDTWERYGRAVELLEERRREHGAMLGAAGDGGQIARATIFRAFCDFSFSVNMASDAGRLCENSGSDGELPSADFRFLKRLLAALASCCVFVRGPRFCFSVHSVFSTPQAKFPRIMRSFRFRFRRTFRFIRTARTGADRTTRGRSCRRIAAVLPPFFRFLFPCRFRFHVSLWQKAQSAAHA